MFSLNKPYPFGGVEKRKGEMRLKKYLSILLVLVAGLCIPPAQAAATPTVSISSGTVAPGGEVTLTVTLQENPGISGMMLYFYYDTSVFTVDPGKDLKTAGLFRQEGGLLGNTIAAAKKTGRYDGDMSRDGVLGMWYNSSGLNSTGSGEIITITLHAVASAQAGSYEIGLGYSPKNVCNQNSDQVPLTTLSGTVTVTDGGGQSAGDKTEEPDNTQPSGSATQPEEKPVFSDIAGNWAEEYINRASDRGLVVGYDGKYRPNDSMTRAELVTILWRVNGSPKGGTSTFTDLTQDWYKDAVTWAEQSGVVYGVGGGRFDPLGHVSREQLAAILHRMAKSPAGMEGMFTGLYDGQYTDSANVSDWAKGSLYWTIYNEIYCGEESLTVGKTLSPKSDADRAQIAVMMVRYLEQNEGRNKN